MLNYVHNNDHYITISMHLVLEKVLHQNREDVAREAQVKGIVSVLSFRTGIASTSDLFSSTEMLFMIIHDSK